MKKLFILTAVIWLIIILGMIGVKEFTIRTGTEVLLKTQPVDPRDLFRGDYVILSYEITRLQANISEFEINNGDQVYIGLTVDEEGYASAYKIFKQPPIGLYIKGTATIIGTGFGNFEGTRWLNINYGIENYFVPEGEGREIERAWDQELVVKVTIDKNGNALIRTLYLDGQEVFF